MSFAPFTALRDQSALRIVLVALGCDHSITLSGLAQPLQLAASLASTPRLQVQVVAPGTSLPPADITLLIADDNASTPEAAHLHQWISQCRQSVCWGAVGAAVLWCARAGAFDGIRTALPWSLYVDTDEAAERAILTPNLYEFDGNRLTCCGGTASIDFAMTIIDILYGAVMQAHIKEALCIDRIRGADERQRIALQARFGMLQPKLSEAVSLMEANLEEPLGADDIAELVGLSRRQLDRLFKQYLASVPSRYYLELRLQRARKLLLESNHSIVQVGLLCGFSSGSHFSTAYGSLFGITPREQRQRKMQSVN